MHLTPVTLEFASLAVDGEGTTAVHFRPRRPLAFTAGQHGLWLVPGGGIKPFTIASAPEEDVVTLGTNLGSRSRFKRALAALEPGSTARFIGPLGTFTLEGAAPSVVMLAQGLGVTPFRSMLRHAAVSGAGTDTTLVHVAAHHPFRAHTEAAAGATSYPTSRQEFDSVVADVAARRSEATFMVSGSPAFVRSTTALLTASSVPTRQIRRDRFYGYSPTPVAAPPERLGV